MVDCKYQEEKALLYTYEEDLHPLERSQKAVRTGKDVSPALHYEHFLGLLEFFDIDLNGKTILNLGCGHGTLDAKILSQFDCKLTGVEFSPKRTRRCRSMARMVGVESRATFINQDIHLFLETHPVRYDIIMAFEVIEHLTQQKEVMKGIREHLKKGGQFIGSVPIQPNGAPEQHISPFKTMDEAKEKLNVEIFHQSKIRMRSPECRAITFKR